jgi:hypothetical protein
MSMMDALRARRPFVAAYIGRHSKFNDLLA